MATLSAARIITPKKISERLNRALAARNVDHHGRGTELARLTGVSPQAAAKWLSGQVMPNNDNLLRIAAQYGIDLIWLMTGDGDMFIDEDFQVVKFKWRDIDARGRDLLVTMSSQLANSPPPNTVVNNATR